VNKDSINELPRARKENLIVKEVDGEVLVYDLTNDRAHCLNETAARIWKKCDGNRTVAELAALLAAETNSTVPDEVMWLALDQLKKFDLLEAVPAAPATFIGINRREWVRNVGLAAIALPVIISIAAPTAQAQGSPCSLPARPAGCPCTADAQCASNGLPGGGCNTGLGTCK
jgi:hypothetical protein